MATNETLIPIPGRLHSVASDGITTGADEIYDDAKQMDQSAINAEFDAEIALLNGNDVEVVPDHTQVQNPDPQKIYRETGDASYSDWMYYNNDWVRLARYSQQPEVNWADTGQLTVTYNT